MLIQHRYWNNLLKWIHIQIKCDNCIYNEIVSCGFYFFFCSQCNFVKSTTIANTLSTSVDELRYCESRSTDKYFTAIQPNFKFNTIGVATKHSVLFSSIILQIVQIYLTRISSEFSHCLVKLNCCFFLECIISILHISKFV